MAWSFDVEECEAGAGYGTDSPGIQSDLIEASEPDFEVGVGLLRQGAQRADHLVVLAFHIRQVAIRRFLVAHAHGGEVAELLVAEVDQHQQVRFLGHADVDQRDRFFDTGQVGGGGVVLAAGTGLADPQREPIGGRR